MDGVVVGGYLKADGGTLAVMKTIGSNGMDTPRLQGAKRAKAKILSKDAFRWNR